MSQKFAFRGLMAPVFTPFKNDGFQINYDIIPKYAQYLKDLKVNGILVNGTSGEGPSLNTSERMNLVEKWCESRLPGQTIMVQVGGTSLTDVLEMTRHAQKYKADALLCLPELYFKPSNINQLIDYLSIVGAAAPETPLFYYHIPAFTNINFDMAELLKSNSIPTFSGIKFTSSDLVSGSACIKASVGKRTVFLGADQIMSAACTLGFDSAIATTLNFAPNLSHNIFNNFKTNEIQESQRAQEKLTNLVETITKYGDWVTSMKAAMNILSPINVGPVRQPLKQPANEKLEQLKNDIHKLSISSCELTGIS